MPNINTLAEVLAQPDWPYHYHYDNLPLKQILLREDMINAAVDANTKILTDAKGTMTDLAARLGVSFNDDGTLKSTVITNIGIDNVVDDSTTYVKMLLTERTKLDAIASDATNLTIGCNSKTWNQGTVSVADSATIKWYDTSPNPGEILLTPQLASFASIIRSYNVQPNTVDDLNYTIGMPIIANSLRVYVNGVRLNPDSTVGVFINSVWESLSYTSVDTVGTFVMNQTLDYSAVVRVDYDRTGL